jgi:hypothetical protein
MSAIFVAAALALLLVGDAQAQFQPRQGNQNDDKQNQSERKNNQHQGPAQVQGQAQGQVQNPVQTFSSQGGVQGGGQGNHVQFGNAQPLQTFSSGGQANGRVLTNQPQQGTQVFSQPTGVGQNNQRILSGQNPGQTGSIIVNQGSNPATVGGNTIKLGPQTTIQGGKVITGQGQVITFGQQGGNANNGNNPNVLNLHPKHSMPLYDPQAGSQPLQVDKSNQNSVLGSVNGVTLGQSSNNSQTQNLHVDSFKNRLPQAGKVTLPNILPGTAAGSASVLNAHGQQMTLNKPVIDLNLQAGSTQNFHPDVVKPHHLDYGKVNLNALQVTQLGNQFHVADQMKLHKQGDVVRQLNLQQQLIANGGWNNRLVHGPVTANYMSQCYSYHYCGPSCYPSSCWLPSWSPWVSWCWWSWCDPMYDPRPWTCRPVWYQPCQPITIVEYPVYQPLYSCSCGTWVDVPVVQAANVDLQLLAVRFVDPGHPEQQLGPRYRVWLRNNSNVDIDQPFNTSLIASGNDQLQPNSPQAGVRVPRIKAGETQAVDIRLPIEVNSLSVAADGQRAPFTTLCVMVDSGREVAETDNANNGAKLPRDQVLPIDPALFAAENPLFVAGNEVSLAGEGLGPEAGQFIITVGNQTFQGEIEGWFDLGVRIRLPNFQMNQSVDAQVVVVRGDGAFSNPLAVTLVPETEAKVSMLKP